MPDSYRRIFVTGGAGFIGSRLVARLMKACPDTEFLILDNLLPQVHGEGAIFPDLGPKIKFVKGDVSDAAAVEDAVKESDPDLVIHLASDTGTGQSLDEIQRYCAVNVGGTANLLAALGRLERRPRSFFLSSSRAVYGEGPYRAASGEVVVPPQRPLDQMRAGRFEVLDSAGQPMQQLAMAAHHPAHPISVYSTTKLTQEHLLLNVAEARELVPLILRYQNVYGAGQSLRNPYTGVLSVFAKLLKQGEKLNIYEDGNIVRDFVHVDDVVEASVTAILRGQAIPQPIDIGSGEASTILDVARTLIKVFNLPEDHYFISGDFRVGDIRGAVADISRARAELDFTPRISLSQGLAELGRWVESSS